MLKNMCKTEYRFFFIHSKGVIGIKNFSQVIRGPEAGSRDRTACDPQKTALTSLGHGRHIWQVDQLDK